jgi:hypothetical protein
MNEATESLHFSDAYAMLAQQLGSAQSQVVCALAAPCAKPLFDLLLGCRRRGLALTLLVPGAAEDIAPGVAWERLQAAGATLHWLAATAPRLHTSVCVVDGALVLSGDLARLGPVPEPHTAGVLLQRSSALAALCGQGLGALLVAFAQAQDPAPQVRTQGAAYPHSDALMAFDDPSQWAADWHTGLLEAHALALQADIAEMHRTLNAFDHAQDASIGSLLRQCMDAKRQHLQQLHAKTGSEASRAQAQEAQDSFARYTQAQDAKPAAPSALDPQAQAQLKQLYRKLAMRLHPDRVDEQDKPEAQALFQRLQTSYENNDFAALQTLQEQLLHAPGAARGASPLRRNAMRSAASVAAALKDRLAQQQQERAAIVRSATWQTLSRQSNWAVWFAQQASYLRAELDRYAQALASSTAQPTSPSTTKPTSASTPPSTAQPAAAHAP